MPQLSSSQLGEWVFNEIQNRPSSLHDRANRLAHIAYLMEQGADPAWNTDMLQDGVTRSHKGYTLAMAAAYCADADMIKLLASYNVNMSAKDNNDMTPLSYALQYAEDKLSAPLIEAAVLALIAGKADVTDGTPVINAAGGGLNTAITALLAAGADVNAQNTWGETALVAAVAKQKIETVKLLLAAGANPEWVSQKTGKTLSDLANDRAKAGVEGILIAREIDTAIALRTKSAPKGPKL